MSTRAKHFLKQAKTKHKKEQKLETADDFQAAGVDFEDAAGKWRVGDPVKSMRFFQRAIEVYDQGLQKFPQSLDLAYNKARVQLEIVTHPLLVKQLQQPVIVAFESALASHRIALLLDQENADSLFNTSQVLTGLAEEIAKDDLREDAEALRLLEEALQLQSRCLQFQEVKFAESQQLHRQPAPTPPLASSNDSEIQETQESSSSIESKEEQWFSIVEPITLDVLIDSILAQLNTLTSLCSILCGSRESIPPATLPWIEDYSTKILAKLPNFTHEAEPSRLREIALAKATFISSLLEAGFRAGKIDVDTYQRERDAAFTQPDLQLEATITAVIANARSKLSFSSALSESFSNPAQMQAQLQTTAHIQWTTLTKSISQLQKASKLPESPAEDLAQTHLLRGDASLQQFVLSQPPTEYPTAKANSAQLLKNAQVFYRNAAKLMAADSAAGATMSADDLGQTATFKGAVAVYLADGDRSGVLSAARGYVPGDATQQAWIQEQIEDMLGEGLLPRDFTW